MRPPTAFKFRLLYIIVISNIFLSSCEKAIPDNMEFDKTKSAASIVTINTTEIGGQGLKLLSSRDNDSPLDNGKFNTVGSLEGAQLMLITDDGDKLRALTLSTPSDNHCDILEVNALSTAICLIFSSPGILTINTEETHAVVQNIMGLSNFDAFKNYLQENLKSKSLNELIQETNYSSILEKCITEYYNNYKVTEETKADYRDYNLFRINRTNNQIELENFAFRFVNVMGLEIDSSNELNKVHTILAPMKGGIPLSWGKILTLSAGRPTKEIIEYIPEVESTSYSEFWVVGPGLKQSYNTPPDIVKEMENAITATIFYYCVFPLFDLFAGVMTFDSTAPETLMQLISSVKITQPVVLLLSEPLGDRAPIDVASGLIDLVVSCAKTYAQLSGSTALSAIIAKSLIVFSGANLMNVVYDFLRIEPYAKYDIISPMGPPTVPILLAPQNNSTDIAGSAMLKWDSYNADSYEIQVSKEPDLATLDYSFQGRGFKEQEISGLVQNTKYYWRIKAFNINGTSEWSDTWCFTTDISGDWNLIAYYPFNGDAKDVSGNNYNGSVYGTINTQNRYEIPNSALEFDGVDDKIVVPDLNLVQPATLSCWVKTDLTQTGYLYTSDYHEAYFARYYGMAVSVATDGKVHADFGDGSYPNRTVVTSESVISANHWHHIVVIWHSLGNISIYVDGDKKTTEESGNLNLILAANLGDDDTFGVDDKIIPSPSYFKGSLDDIKIYTGELSNLEIVSLFREKKK